MNAEVIRIPNLLTSRIAVWTRNYAAKYNKEGPEGADSYLAYAIPEQFWETIVQLHRRARRVAAAQREKYEEE